MRFCKKLSKVRKDNNLSQEQLAEKIGMSRQAVSKWESGASYPDMATIIELCKILNCDINELLDDDAIKDGPAKKGNKNNIEDWINDFLKMITKIYNMFCSMTFKEKIKCILELLLVGFIMYFIIFVIGVVLSNIIIDLLSFASYETKDAVLGILGFGYSIAGIVIGTIVVLHIFKIRYLDYYVTVEDNTVEEKIVEEPIDENKNIKEDKFGNIIMEKKKEKVIIRDPKHTTYSFFKALGKLFTLIIKICLVFFSMFAICSFIGFIVAIIFSIFYISNLPIFLGIALISLGGLVINYILLEASYNFILNLKYHMKRYFIMFIIGLILIGAGIATTIFETSKLEMKAYPSEKLITNIEYLDYNDNITIDYHHYDTELKVDNSVENIKVEFKRLPIDTCETYTYHDYTYNDQKQTSLEVLSGRCYADPIKIMNFYLDGLKENTIYNIEESDIAKIVFYVSQEHYDKIMENYNILY